MYLWQIRSILAISAWVVVTVFSPVNSAQQTPKAPQIQKTQSDSAYNVLVTEGRRFENEGKLEQALEKFRRALRVKRYEIPSYYVLLDIGRVQYKLGSYPEAINSLQQYLDAIGIELKVQRGEMMPPGALIIPGYTEQGMKQLLQDKAEAEALLLASKSRLLSK